MGVFVVLTCLYYLNYLNTLGLVNIFVMSIILGVVSQIGDLLESFIKRSADIKDTSNILLGHGGFLDRFDSISFAAPFYVIYILNFF
jgi:phosphatidate cytidylyltransferase